MKGIVRWFNNEKGYGFIQSEELNDIFVHYSTILKEGFKSLKEGDHVEFKLKKTDKGLQATDVVIIQMTAI